MQQKNNSNFYADNEAIKKRLQQDLSIEDLSFSDILASERTDLANKRNIFALKRTHQAAERTFSAWLRTGFSIASAGVAISSLLAAGPIAEVANAIGGILIVSGIFSFIYGWYGYFKTYQLLKRMADYDQQSGRPVRTDLFAVTIITILLLITSIIALIGFILS